jgi:hypothetical protein
MGVPQNRSALQGAESNLLPLMGIESRFLDRPASSLTATPSYPGPLTSNATFHCFQFTAICPAHAEHGSRAV